MAEFVAGRDIRINASEAPDGTMHLVSEGLARHGLPELELVGVPHAHAREGAVIINQIAEYTANRARIAPGERVGIAGVCGALVARLVASANAPRKGLGRLFGGGTPGRLRIEEPIDDMAPLATLLSTVLLWRAEAAFEDNDDEAGVAALRAAIELFPGDPTRRDAPNFGIEHNWENHLAYATLSLRVDGDEAIESWERAAERCGRFEVNQLGDAGAELRRLERGALLERARLIVETNTRKTEQNDINEHVFMTLSPIWGPAHDDTHTGRAARKMVVVTRERAYGGEPLLRDPALVAAAIELVLAHRDRPATLVFAIADTLRHWEGGSDDAPIVDAGAPYQTGDRVLSLALAHVSRYVAGGMTASEVRAACGLDDDAGARESALSKRAVLEHAEFEDQVAAISG
ncbi:MAG: hypothetical protein JWP01_3776 [Myxococcales bacterium]|nr:hypothetical protein [Myxococcales bacterium]